LPTAFENENDDEYEIEEMRVMVTPWANGSAIFSA